MFEDVATEKKALMAENEHLKSESSNLKTQLETEQAKVWLYIVLFANTGKACIHACTIYRYIAYKCIYTVSIEDTNDYFLCVFHFSRWLTS